MRGKNRDRVTNAHSEDFNREFFDEEVDADFEKCFGRKKCIERTSRFEENTSERAKHSIRTRHNTNPRSEVFGREEQLQTTSVKVT